MDDILENALTVIIVPDNYMWYAQGLQYDYASCGINIVQTIENFSNGLKLNVDAKCEMCNIMIQEAPEKWWNKFHKSKNYDEIIKKNDMIEKLPFDHFIFRVIYD